MGGGLVDHSQQAVWPRSGIVPGVYATGQDTPRLESSAMSAGRSSDVPVPTISW
jgi:hypothetical protein